jgi:hypothetical protein
VNASLAPRLPLEVLDDIRPVGGPGVDSGLGERLVEQPARGAYERLSLLILTVSWLLTDEHHGRSRGPRAEHRLGRVAPQRARLAPSGRLAQRLDASARRHEARGIAALGGGADRDRAASLAGRIGLGLG